MNAVTGLPHTCNNIRRPGLAAGILPLLSALVLAGGCSSDPANPMTSTGATGGSSGTGGSAAAGDPNAIVGNFDVELKAPVPATNDTEAVPGYTSITGRVLSGPLPPPGLKQTGQEGDCKLLAVSIPSCPPPGCGTNGACVAISATSTMGTCVPYPVGRSAGKVTFTGLTTESGPAPVVLDPQMPGSYYQDGPEAKLAYPAFQEGADIALSAAGAETPAFTATAKGIRLLEVIASGPIKLEKNQPMALRWTKPAQPAQTRIEIELDISHHGGPKGVITCDTADSGALDIPASLTTGLINLGVAGFPTISITRHAIGYAQLPTGKVALKVMSSSLQPVVVPGFVSCDEKELCPAGKTCGVDSLCK